MGVAKHVRRIAPRFWFSCKCLRYKFYNGEPEIRLVRHLLPRGELALDIGSSIGIYSREMAKYAVRVVAFEANPRVAAFARQVAPHNVEVVNVALSSAGGKTTLRIPLNRRDDTIDDLATIEPTNRLNSGPVVAQEVATKPLDDFGFTGCGFIKIDAEGHEEAVLSGGMGLIETQRPVMMIELDDRFNPGIIARVTERLSRFSYGAYLSADGGLRPLAESRFAVERERRPKLHLRAAGRQSAAFPSSRRERIAPVRLRDDGKITPDIPEYACPPPAVDQIKPALPSAPMSFDWMPGVPVRRFRHVAADFLRVQRVAHVDRAQAGVEISEEHDIRPRPAGRQVLQDVVGAEAAGTIVIFFALGQEGRDRHRVSLLACVDDPHELRIPVFFLARASSVTTR